MATAVNAPASMLITRGLFPAIAGAGVVYSLTERVDYAGHRALLLASVVMLVIFAILEVAVVSGTRRKYGWTAVLLGADGRVSTSKTSVWLWTLGLAYGLLFLTGIAVFGREHDGTTREALFSPSNWDDYLILLGGPFTAGVLAKFAVVTKLNNGTIDRSTVTGLAANGAGGTAAPATAGASSGLSDVVTDDSGGLDIVDTQYLIFNLVAFTYAAGVFISNNFNHLVSPDEGKYSLPTIPSTILALTSAAAATYTGNKALQKDTPGISQVTPSAGVTAGTDVTITGSNLVPADTAPAIAASQTVVWVTAGDGTGTPVSVTSTLASSTTVVFVMPAGFAGKRVNLIVVSTGAVPSRPFPIDAA